MNPLLIGLTVGIDLLSNYFSGKTVHDTASEQLKVNQEVLTYLDKATSDTSKAYSQQKQLITDSFGNAMQDLAEKIGLAGTQLSFELEDAESRIGLTKSGSLDVMRNIAYDRFRNQYVAQRRNILESYGEKLMNLERWKSETLGNIKMQQFALKKEMAAQRTQKKSKFLGIIPY